MNLPSERIWNKISPILVGENLPEVVATLLQGVCALICAGGAAGDELEARALLAATLLSPGDVEIGELEPLLAAAYAKLESERASVH